LAEDADYRAAIADYEIKLKTYEFLELRTLSNKTPGAEASYLKLLGTELQQQATELLLQAVGYYGSPYVREALDYGYNQPSIGPEYAAPLAPQYFNTRKTSIYAGSNEIQRNIMAKAVLGM
jgi:alkylation response protein AidB-like acyl-CoA dehydrogenase